LVIAAWNNMNIVMRLQLSYVEQVTGTYNLVDWWDAWLIDYKETVAVKGQAWAHKAIETVMTVMQESNSAALTGKEAKVTATIMAQLGQWADGIKNMVLPPTNALLLLPPPGTSKRDVADAESWFSETDPDAVVKLELDEAIWQKSLEAAVEIASEEAEHDGAAVHTVHSHIHRLHRRHDGVL
jgi:hypothetical protein